MLQSKLSGVIRRSFSASAGLKSSFQQHGIPGSNVPFSIKNRIRLAIYTSIYFSSGLSYPFIVLRHQLIKKNKG
ncbi:hypothetical protein ScPMuIL_003225 [Solemya velum]